MLLHGLALRLVLGALPPIPHIAGLGDMAQQYISTVAYKLTDPLFLNCETFAVIRYKSSSIIVEELCSLKYREKTPPDLSTVLLFLCSSYSKYCLSAVACHMDLLLMSLSRSSLLCIELCRDHLRDL